MDKKLRVRLINLITDTIGHYESKLEDNLDSLDLADTSYVGDMAYIAHVVDAIKKTRDKINEYRTLLNDLEEYLDQED